MNPTEIEEAIRDLDLILYRGCPVRPDADFGRDIAGHFDGEKARGQVVNAPPLRSEPQDRIIVERYIISQDGQMHVTSVRGG